MGIFATLHEAKINGLNNDLITVSLQVELKFKCVCHTFKDANKSAFTSVCKVFRADRKWERPQEEDAPPLLYNEIPAELKSSS